MTFGSTAINKNFLAGILFLTIFMNGFAGTFIYRSIKPGNKGVRVVPSVLGWRDTGRYGTNRVCPCQPALIVCPGDCHDDLARSDLQ